MDLKEIERAAAMGEPIPKRLFLKNLGLTTIQKYDIMITLTGCSRTYQR